MFTYFIVVHVFLSLISLFFCRKFNILVDQKIEKHKKFSLFLTDFEKIDHLLDYFEEFNENLSKKTLNSYLKSVSNP